MIRRRLDVLLFTLSLVLSFFVVTNVANAQGGTKKKAPAPAAHHDDAPDPAPAPAHDEKADKPAPKETAEAAEEAAEDAAHHHAPRQMKVAIVLDKLNKFEVGPGTFHGEFFFFVCDAEPCKPDPELSNGKISGKDKIVDEPLAKVFRVKAELDAAVDLSEFPFDKHALPLMISDKDENITYVHDAAFLKSFNLPTINPEVRLAGWDIEKELNASTVTHKLEGGMSFSELSFETRISRPRVASFFKTLVPVFFMIFVAGFTLLLKPKSAAGRLTAATGGLMTVVMFHLSATSSLPPLGYLTRMDKFMIATYLVYLVNIMFAIAIVRFDEKKNEKLAELAYLAAGGTVPGVALLAWLTVFLRIV